LNYEACRYFVVLPGLWIRKIIARNRNKVKIIGMKKKGKENIGREMTGKQD
jgi:hypothetical protein